MILVINPLKQLRNSAPGNATQNAPKYFMPGMYDRRGSGVA